MDPVVVIYAFLDRSIAYWDGPLRTSVRIPRSPEGLPLVTVPTKDVALRARTMCGASLDAERSSGPGRTRPGKALRAWGTHTPLQVRADNERKQRCRTDRAPRTEQN